MHESYRAPRHPRRRQRPRGMPGRHGASRLASVLCLLILAAGCSDSDEHIFIPAPPGDTVTTVFQDGVAPNAGYGGTRDAFIKDGPGEGFRNMNYGASPIDSVAAARLTTLLYERRYLVRFDLASITSCTQVIEARLELRVVPLDPDSTAIELHEVTLAGYPSGSWLEGLGGLAAGVSWTTIDGGTPWTAGGSFNATILAEATIRSDTAIAFTLPPALAYKWIKYPALNHGVILTSAYPSRESALLVRASESMTAAWRPRFVVRYLPGG